MPRSEAQKRADKKYNAKTYHRYAVNMRVEYIEAIEEYKERQGINSDSGIFITSLLYCIKNNIDLSESKK